VSGPRPVVLILASGRSERFLASGGQGSKLEALLAGKPVLQHTLDAVRASGLPCHLERAAHPGMGDSIAAAVRATCTATGWLILPADLPLIRPATLMAVAHALLTHAVVTPEYAGQCGHPVGFAASCLEPLLALRGEQGARHIAQAGEAWRLPVNDSGTVTDIDTLDDLQRVARLLARGQSAP